MGEILLSNKLTSSKRIGFGQYIKRSKVWIGLVDMGSSHSIVKMHYSCICQTQTLLKMERANSGDMNEETELVDSAEVTDADGCVV